MSAAILCDQCKAVEARPTNTVSHRFTEVLPDGWVYVQLGNGREGGASGEFCSLACAAQWVSVSPVLDEAPAEVPALVESV